MSIPNITKSKILISPLNWGLGHVTRTIPIIDVLLKQDNELFICCDEQQEEFYRDYFPDLWYIQHSGYPFKFKGNGKWMTDTIKNFIPLYLFLKKERLIVDELIEQFNPDLIISDQRFGFRSSKVKSVIVSHQLNLPVPKWNLFAKLWNKNQLNQFDEIWIPDDEKQTFSGELSNGKHKNKRFIGVCSRFQLEDLELNENHQFIYENLGIVSGPFPYNLQFLNELLTQFSKSKKKSAIIFPKELYQSDFENRGVDLFPSTNNEKFLELIKSSEKIVSRSGYSTIMDLAILQKEAILIPTPNQTEQIYLAKLHHKNGRWDFLE